MWTKCLSLRCHSIPKTRPWSGDYFLKRMRLKPRDITRRVDSQSGSLTANTSLFPLQLTAHFWLVSPNPLPNAGTTSIWVGSTLCQEQCHCQLVIIKCHFNALTEKPVPCCWMQLVQPRLNSSSLMTHSIHYLASGFQKYTCNCLPLPPFISFHYCSNCASLFPFLQLFSIDYAIMEVATPDSPTLQFVQLHLKKWCIWKKNNYSFHLLLLIIVVGRRINPISLIISERQSRALWRVLQGFPTANDFISPTSESRNTRKHHDPCLEQPVRGFRASPLKTQREKN